MLRSPVILGLDFGGTKIAVAVCSLDGTRLGSAAVGSGGGELGARASFDRGIRAAHDLLGPHAAPEAELAAVGAATFGIPFEDRVELAPAIDGWESGSRSAANCAPRSRATRKSGWPPTPRPRPRPSCAGAPCRAAIRAFTSTWAPGSPPRSWTGGQVVSGGGNGAAGEIGYNLRARRRRHRGPGGAWSPRFIEQRGSAGRGWPGRQRARVR